MAEFPPPNGAPTTIPISEVIADIPSMFASIPRTFVFLGHEYSVLQMIRMVVILGGYILIRPMLLKLAEKIQAKGHERDAKEEAEEEASAMSSGRQIPGEETEEVEGSMSWGAKARKREKKRLEDEAERLRELDSDDELEMMLEDC